MYDSYYNLSLHKDFENPMGEKTLKGELKMMSACLDMGVFPGTQGGPLEHVIAAKAIAYQEALSDEYMLYCVQVIKNAQTMAKALIEKGYKIISGDMSKIFCRNNWSNIWRPCSTMENSYSNFIFIFIFNSRFSSSST